MNNVITDIVSTANSIGADTIYYNVEIVTLGEDNKFVVYLSFEYEFEEEYVI